MKHSSLGKNWSKTEGSSIFSTRCALHILKRWRSWNHLERAGTPGTASRSSLEQCATNCTKMELATNWLKKTRNSLEGNCYRNTISQKDTKLAIVIVERNTISDIHRWNRLEHDRTSNELAQIIRDSWGKTACIVSLVYRTYSFRNTYSH